MVNEDNKGKGAYTPAVVMLAIGGLGLLLGLLPLSAWDSVSEFLDNPAKPLFLVIFTLGVVLAVEYGVICLLHRKPETRRKVAWEFLSPTVTLVAAGSIIVVGAQVTNLLKMDTDKISCQLEDLSKNLRITLVDMGTAPIANKLDGIRSRIEQSSGNLVEKLDALNRQLQQLRALNDIERRITNAGNDLEIQGSALVERLDNIAERIEGLSFPQPVRISVRDDLNPIFDRLEKTLEESIKASAQVIRKQIAELAELEHVHQKQYERKVDLDKRHFGKKTKHFFFGIK